MSLAYVPVFSATTRSISGGRAVYPSLLTRMSYQVGRPWMFDGKMFLPETGIPIRKIDCMSSALALALPVPLTVAILKEKTLTRAESRRPEAGGQDLEPLIPRLRRFLRAFGFGLPASGFRLPALQTHTESPTRTSSYPTPPSGSARRRARSAGRRLRPSP